MSLFKPKFVTIKIGDQMVNFYSLSIPVLYAMKSAIGPVAKLLTNFFRGARNDVSRLQETSVDEHGRPVQLVSASPMSVEMAKLRHEQSEAAHREILETLFGDENRVLLGRVLMDSMRDNFPRKPNSQQVEEFLDGLDLSMLVELAQGVAKANGEVFGPLGQKWATKAQSLLRAQASSESPNSAAESEPKPDEPQVQSCLRLMPKD